MTLLLIVMSHTPKPRQKFVNGVGAPSEIGY